MFSRVTTVTHLPPAFSEQLTVQIRSDKDPDVTAAACPIGTGVILRHNVDVLNGLYNVSRVQWSSQGEPRDDEAVEAADPQLLQPHFNL